MRRSTNSQMGLGSGFWFGVTGESKKKNGGGAKCLNRGETTEAKNNEMHGSMRMCTRPIGAWWLQSAKHPGQMMGQGVWSDRKKK